MRNSYSWMDWHYSVGLSLKLYLHYEGEHFRTISDEVLEFLNGKCTLLCTLFVHLCVYSRGLANIHFTIYTLKKTNHLHYCFPFVSFVLTVNKLGTI